MQTSDKYVLASAGRDSASAKLSCNATVFDCISPHVAEVSKQAEEIAYGTAYIRRAVALLHDTVVLRIETRRHKKRCWTGKLGHNTDAVQGQTKRWELMKRYGMLCFQLNLMIIL